MSTHINTSLFYDAYYSSVVESSVSFLARQVERPRLERLNLLSMAWRAYRDPFQIIYDGLSGEKSGTFKFHLDVEVLPVVEIVPKAKSFTIAEYEPLNKDVQPFIPPKPTLPALQSALGTISYDIFGFPTHRQQSRCLPDDFFIPDPQSILEPSHRIISRPTHPDEYNTLKVPASPAQFSEEVLPSVAPAVNFIFNENVHEIGSPPESTASVDDLPESSPLITASEASSGASGSSSTDDTPLNTPRTSAPDLIALDEIINGFSDDSSVKLS